MRNDDIIRKGNVNESTVSTEEIATINWDYLSTGARFADDTKKGGTNYKE